MRRGIEWPYTSASNIPTRRPFIADATARFAVNDDFPTPPLPDATPMTRVSESACANEIKLSRPLRRSFLILDLCSSSMTPKVIFTVSIPSMAPTALSISLVNLSRMGQPEIVNRISSSAVAALTATDFTIPSSGSARCSSGS